MESLNNKAGTIDAPQTNVIQRCQRRFLQKNALVRFTKCLFSACGYQLMVTSDRNTLDLTGHSAKGYSIAFIFIYLAALKHPLVVKKRELRAVWQVINASSAIYSRIFVVTNGIFTGMERQNRGYQAVVFYDAYDLQRLWRQVHLQQRADSRRAGINDQPRVSDNRVPTSAGRKQFTRRHCPSFSSAECEFNHVEEQVSAAEQRLFDRF